MKYLIIALFTLSTNLFAQNLETLKQHEVLFILHRGTNGNYQSKNVLVRFKNKEKRPLVEYNFFVVDQDVTVKDVQIRLVYNHYYDFDEEFRNNPVPYFKVNKNFLKENKEIIITGDFLNKLGFRASSKLLHNAKTIFLVDKSEIRDDKIIIKEVKYDIIYDE